MKFLPTSSRIIIAIFCIVAATILLKVELLDHQWISFNRTKEGFVDGWNTPEDAITKGRWKGGEWDSVILSSDSFKVRKHVNPITGYILPLALLCGAAIVLVKSRTEGK